MHRFAGLAALAVPASALAASAGNARGTPRRSNDGSAMVVDLADFSWNGASYTFRNDGQPVDPAAIDALRDLLKTSTASHLEIVAPPGTINLGIAATARIHIQRSNVTLRGSGKNATRFVFQSTYSRLPMRADAQHDTVFEGTGIAVARSGQSGWTRLENVTLRDFELEDVNPQATQSADYVTINVPSGIFAYAVDRIELIDLRTVNCKGNASITINGMTDSAGPANHGVLGLNVDIIGDAARPGKFASGDGWNVGSYRDVKIVGGSIIRVNRHAFEGGTPGRDILFDGLFVDQQMQGMSGINPTGYAEVRVVNCHVRNIANGYHVDFTNDPGATGHPSMRNLVIANNILEGGSGPGASSSPIRTQTIGWPSLLGNVAITGNVFTGDFYYIWTLGANDVPSGIFAGNILRDCIAGRGSRLISTAGTATAPADTDKILISGNLLPAGMTIVDFTVNPAWKNKRYLHAHDNVWAGEGLTAGAGTQYGSLVVGNAGALGGSVAPHSVSAPHEVEIGDATPGDHVVIHPAPSWPIGQATELCGYVSANNRVAWCVRNNTDRPSPMLGAAHGFFIDLIRR